MCATLFSVSIGSPHRSLGHLHREGLQALAVFRSAVHPLVDEVLSWQAVLQDVARHRREPDQIGAGPRMQKYIRAPRHLVLAQVGDNQFLPAKLMRALDARRQHRMALGGIAADDQHQLGLLDVGNRAGIATIANRSQQPRSCRGLAVARAVIHVIGADHGAGQLLHQVAFFVGALRRRDERQRIRPVRCLDFGKPARHQS